jgi:hypothetical protein
MEKAERVANFHANTLKAVAQLLGAAGLHHAKDLTPDHILRRTAEGQIDVLSHHLLALGPGVLNTSEAESALNQYAPNLGKLWSSATASQWHR